MAEHPELPPENRGETPKVKRSAEARPAARDNERSGIDRLMERVVVRGNASEALKRVRQNKGSPGIDSMTVDALSAHLRTNWQAIKAKLLEGSYQPSPVREMEIPKDGGGIAHLTELFAWIIQ